jgi:AcrR family transcriptional regulator
MTERSVYKIVIMSPRTVEQYEELRETRKTKIMNVALELFANEGYYPTSISMIADKAGISKGLMYNYFESKEALIKEIMFKGIEEITKFFDPNQDGILTREEMEYFIHETFNILKENLDYWKLYFTTVLQPPVYDLIKDEVSRLMPKFASMLIRFYEQQKVENPAHEALLFGALMDGIGFNYIMAPESYPIEEIEKLVIKKVLYK